MLGDFYEWFMSWSITLTGGLFWFAIYSMISISIYSLYEIAKWVIGLFVKYRKG